MSERSSLIQDIVDLRYPSDRPEDRLGGQNLAQGLASKSFGELQKILERMKADPEYMPR